MKPSHLIPTVVLSFLLIAFFTQSLKLIKSEGEIYGLLNLFIAAIAGYASWLIQFYPFVFLEGVWCRVAIYSLVKKKNISLVSRETTAD